MCLMWRHLTYTQRRPMWAICQLPDSWLTRITSSTHAIEGYLSIEWHKLKNFRKNGIKHHCIYPTCHWYILFFSFFFVLIFLSLVHLKVFVEHLQSVKTLFFSMASISEHLLQSCSARQEEKPSRNEQTNNIQAACDTGQMKNSYYKFY